MSEPFVVKAQCSLFSSSGQASVLIYDNGKNVMHQGHATQDMVDTIGERSFWWAIVNDNKKIEILRESNEYEYNQFSFDVMNPRKVKHENHSHK